MTWAQKVRWNKLLAFECWGVQWTHVTSFRLWPVCSWQLLFLLRSQLFDTYRIDQRLPQKSSKPADLSLTFDHAGCDCSADFDRGVRDLPAASLETEWWDDRACDDDPDIRIGQTAIAIEPTARCWLAFSGAICSSTVRRRYSYFAFSCPTSPA